MQVIIKLLGSAEALPYKAVFENQSNEHRIESLNN